MQSYYFSVLPPKQIDVKSRSNRIKSIKELMVLYWYCRIALADETDKRIFSEVPAQAEAQAPTDETELLSYLFYFSNPVVWPEFVRLFGCDVGQGGVTVGFFFCFHRCKDTIFRAPSETNRCEKPRPQGCRREL
ncbi:MAG: hypothetical protein K2I51_07885 [Muribaculaceae bacterium]|nr:hypothetical protein [Muribaculaceae bacterium]